MILHTTHLPATANARYHSRRLARLRTALGNRCELCERTVSPSRPAGFFQVDHTLGNGDILRAAAHGHSGELTRLLGLRNPAEEVRLLCDPCHAATPTTQRFRPCNA